MTTLITKDLPAAFLSAYRQEIDAFLPEIRTSKYVASKYLLPIDAPDLTEPMKDYFTIIQIMGTVEWSGSEACFVIYPAPGSKDFIAQNAEIWLHNKARWAGVIKAIKADANQT